MNVMDDQPVGGYGAVHPATVKLLKDAIEWQHAQIPFKNGATAAFWHLIAVLNDHLADEPK